ncbi:MAG TPA: hypothetical protein VE780_12970 [Thermoleophilaceae bacterium]|nr:hypothetical protein [Thermoleophilaceae bacterium]
MNGDLALLEPKLEARRIDDPVLRFAAAMCRLAMEIELGLAEDRHARSEPSATPVCS